MCSDVFPDVFFPADPALAQGVIQSMSLTRLARLTAAVLLVIVGCGVAIVAFSSAGAPVARVTAAAQGKDTPANPPPQPANEADESARKRFEMLAGQLTIFQTQDFAYGRPADSDNLLNQLAPKKLEPWAKVSAAIGANRDASADLAALLKHPGQSRANGWPCRPGFRGSMAGAGRDPIGSWT
jgi:hypothetical protein